MDHEIDSEKNDDKEIVPQEELDLILVEVPSRNKTENHTRYCQKHAKNGDCLCDIGNSV